MKPRDQTSYDVWPRHKRKRINKEKAERSGAAISEPKTPTKLTRRRFGFYFLALFWLRRRFPFGFGFLGLLGCCERIRECLRVASSHQQYAAVFTRSGVLLLGFSRCEKQPTDKRCGPKKPFGKSSKTEKENELVLQLLVLKS
ncbi:hypothetical protein MHYP_G00223250 [Metynnis hypsauchen]